MIRVTADAADWRELVESLPKCGHCDAPAVVVTGDVACCLLHGHGSDVRPLPYIDILAQLGVLETKAAA